MRLRLGLVTALLLLPVVASAQFMSTDPFTVSLSPDFPTPYGQVILTPTSNFITLSNATMLVTVNGTQLYNGAAQSLAVPLGAPGALTTIVVTMTSNGEKFTKTLSVRPQDVALVVEPVASSPVLYPGKPLIPLEGSVRMVALANMKDAKGAMIDPAKLSYRWYVDTTEILGSSGIGKDTLLVASPLQYRARDVTVRVQSQDGSVSGGARLTIEPKEPIVRIYENDSLLGVLFDRAVANSYNITSAEKSLYAAPYSFATKGGVPLLKWFLNGASAQTGPVITLRPTGQGAGTASLSLVASTGSLVSATANLSLTFGAAKGGLGIFGL